MVRSIDIHDDGRVDVVVSLTTPGCPIRAQFEQAVVDNVGSVDGVTSVGVGFDVLTDTEKQGLQQKLGRPGGLPEGALAQVKNVICVGLRQGRRRQVDDDRQPRRGADRRGQGGRRARLRRLRLLDPAHARRQQPPARSTPSARSSRSNRRAASR